MQADRENSFFFSRVLFAVKIFIIIIIAAPLLIMAVNYRHCMARYHEIENDLEQIRQIDRPTKLLENLTTLDDKVYKLRLYDQAMGQDFKILQMMDRRSKLSNAEVALDSLDNTLSLLQSYLGGLRQPGKLADLKSVRLSLVEWLPQFRRSITKLDSSLRRSGEANVNFGEAISWIDLIDERAQTDLKWLTGEDGKDKKIMLVFQNNSELRGSSGGSFGSFAIIMISQGVPKIEFGQNIYKIDNEYRLSDKEKITPSEELQFIIGDRLVLKDSGWSTDGREALSNMMNFYQIETGDDLDGVMTLDYSSFASILSIIEPIDMPQYNMTVTADNFKEKVEQEVHVDYFKTESGKAENEPKKIIGEMIPQVSGMLAKKIQDDESLAKLMAVLLDSLKRKDVLLNLKDANLAALLQDLNWSGIVEPAAGDYLFINNSNIDGAKSSLNVKEDLDLSVNIDSKGETSNNLTIARTHEGSDVWPDGLNKNFIRLLLPGNTSVSDFEAKKGNFQQFYVNGYKGNQKYWLTNEHNKNVVNFWMNTLPQTETIAKISYKTGYKLNTDSNFTYELLLQKQPGALPETVNLTINYPAGFRPANVKSYDERLSQLSLKINLDSDTTVKVTFEKVRMEGILKRTTSEFR